MDYSWNGSTASMCQAEHVWCFSQSPNQKESDMNATIVAVDLAKNIFELEEKILGVERELNSLTRADVRVQQLRQIPGIGALTSTALRSIGCESSTGRALTPWAEKDAVA
jgi:hypothetical protein